MKETLSITDNTKLISLLKKINRFKVFSDEDINSFLRLSKIREYEAGEIVIQEETFDYWIYFLLKGSLNIIKNGKIMSQLARCGDIFGEMGVIDGSARSATIQAETKSVVLAIDGAIVDRQIQHHEMGFCYIVYRMFAEVLAIRLRDTTTAYMALKEKYREEEEKP